MAEGYVVYKVVRKREEKMVSCYAPPDLEVMYKIGEKSLPKIGKLFCFKDLNSAHLFIKEKYFFEEGIILLCETNSVDFLPYIDKIPQGSSRDEYEFSYCYFWKSPPIWRESHVGTPIPPGTIFCDYVIPLEEVR
jgi:hypothetical protein